MTDRHVCGRSYNEFTSLSGAVDTDANVSIILDEF